MRNKRLILSKPRGSKAAATKHMRWMVSNLPNRIARVIQYKGQFHIAYILTSEEKAMAHPNPYRYKQ